MSTKSIGPLRYVVLVMLFMFSVFEGWSQITVTGTVEVQIGKEMYGIVYNANGHTFSGGSETYIKIF